MIDIATRYQRAEQRLSWNLLPTLKNLSIRPYWLNEQLFWYKRENQQGHTFILVNCDKLEQAEIFDHQIVARQLSEMFDLPLDATRLPITLLAIENDRHITIAIELTVAAGKKIIIDRVTGLCAMDKACFKVQDKAKPSVQSPDQILSVFEHDHNLYLHNYLTKEERALTFDGQSYFGYGNYTDFISFGLHGDKHLPPAVVWSEDGRYLVVQRIDERHVKSMSLTQTVPEDGSLRPIHHSYRMALPEDKSVGEATLCVIDIENGRIIQCDRPPMPVSCAGFIDICVCVRWSSNNLLYFFELSRDRKTITFVECNPANGATRVLLHETGPISMYPGPIPFDIQLIQVVPQLEEFIWYDNRSGWGHLYRYDLVTGDLKNPITKGEYTVTKLHHVDIETQTLYFSACGREPDRDPYLEHFYRIDLAGHDLVLLTPEKYQHDVMAPQLTTTIAQMAQPDIRGLSENGKYFIDTMSLVDSTPRTVLRSAEDGRELLVLTEFDNAPLQQINYMPPMPFSVKAEDGATDLWGVAYRPSDFDEAESYPVILCMYGTPEVCVTPKRFADMSIPVGDPYIAMAELGFIVIVMDPRGTPLRSLKFHQHSYGDLQNGGGIDDQIIALKQLASQYDWIDLDRAGVTGYSGGGFASARAIMRHGDLFKVAVSSAGNHNPALYVAAWVEAFQGMVKGDNYQGISNADWVEELQGKLLLIHGDKDANVHIAHMMQLVDQLVKHNKDFDLLIMPNRNHYYFEDPYFIRRTWDYFVENLLQVKPPKQYSITKK